MFKSRITPKVIALGIAAAITIALVPSLAAAQAAPTIWGAKLSGSAEVPANASTAAGTFVGTLDEAAGTLTWTLTVPNITNMTAAHLHQGAAGVNGGVVVDLFIPASPQGTVSASGTSRLADVLKGPLAGNAAGFIAAFKGGSIYANVHTTANPGGEIRGQVLSAATTATATPAAATPVATAAVPAPSKTGSAGLASTGSTSIMIAVGLVAAAGAVTFLGRRATRS